MWYNSLVKNKYKGAVADYGTFREEKRAEQRTG
jgi:hypothetical protein